MDLALRYKTEELLLVYDIDGCLSFAKNKIKNEYLNFVAIDNALDIKPPKNVMLEVAKELYVYIPSLKILVPKFGHLQEQEAPDERNTTKKEIWELHDLRCCPKHGCSFGDPKCPVVIGLVSGTPCKICKNEKNEK